MPKLELEKKKPVVMSVGGSMIVPNGGPSVEFIKTFRKLLLAQIKKGQRIVIVVGGGKTARHYIDAAKKISKLEAEDLDWLGIHSTRLNAHLIRTVLRDVAHPVVMKDPTRVPLRWKGKVLVSGGWKPGWSTDYVASRIAKKLGVKTVINVSNVDHVYDKDPNKYKGAKPFNDLKWSEYRKMVGDEWSPGLSTPFDPVASKFCHRHGITVAIASAELSNMKNAMNEKNFEGTILHK